MKIKTILLITIFSVVGLLSAQKKQEHKSWEYYDAERVKVIRTHQLTTDGGYSNPRWSPNGEYISAEMDKGLAIFKIKENGKKVKKICEIPEVYYDEYVWSPDGEKIVYSAKDSAGNFGLWIADIEEFEENDENAKRRLIDTTATPTDWSHSGEKILLNVREGIAIIDTDGSGYEVIVPTGEDETIFYPKFISDTKITYLRGAESVTRSISHKDKTYTYNTSPRGYNFMVFDMENKIETQIVPRLVNKFSWLPLEANKKERKKGKIYYKDSEDIDRKHYIMDEDFSNKFLVWALRQEKISDTKTKYFSMEFEDFSPDGSKFLYEEVISHSLGGMYYNGIYIMNTNGTGERFFIDGSNPDWSPDGKWILYTAKGNLWSAKITRHHND